MSSGTTKSFLKRAVASQRLRGVLVDYEVLCHSTILPEENECSMPIKSVSTRDSGTTTVKPGLMQNVRSLIYNMTKSVSDQDHHVQHALARLPVSSMLVFWKIVKEHY
jgi:hypothetical protein